MDIIFAFPIGILTLFIVINIILSKCHFYKDFSSFKITFLTLGISVFTFFLLERAFEYISIKLQHELLLKGLLNASLSFILLVISFYIGFKFINIINKNDKKEFELNTLHKKIEYKDATISKLRSQKHDYLKHLQVVSSLLNTNLPEDAKNYITNIANSFRSKTSRYGKVSYIDAICAVKYEECLLRGISFDTYVQDFIDNLVIEPNEMSSVLLNILDNAIDALSSVCKDSKYIKLSIYEDEFQYVISILNNGPIIYDTQRIFLEGHSSKIGENRGYGLYSIKQILDKYGYHIFVDSDEFLTEFTILIPKY